MIRCISHLTTLFILQICGIHGLDITKSSLTFLIDDSPSMTDEIEQVKESVDSIFDTVMNANHSHIENFVLVTFNDPDYILHTITKDRYEFKAAAAKVHIRDGILECPERAMQGIQVALENSLPLSTIYVFTDAAAKDDELYEEVKSIAQKKQIQVTFMLTGDCGSRNDRNYQVYHQLANATSGDVFNLMKADINDIVKVIDPKPGVHVADVGSLSTTKAKALARSTVNFQPGFSTFKPISLSGTASRPAADGNVYLSIQLHGEGVKLNTAKILDMSKNVLTELPLYLIDEKNKFYRTDLFNPPHGKMFKVAVHGIDEDTKTPIIRESSTPIERQNPALVKKVEVGPTVKIIEGSNIITEYNTPLQLNCKVHGYPKPDIIWHDETGTPFKATVSTIEDPYDYISILDIAKCDKNTSYTCLASNAQGVDMKTIDVKTKIYFNIVKSPKDKIQINYDKEDSIVCKVEANPPAIITWYKDRRLLTNDTNDRIIISEDTSTVTLKHVNYKSQGNFMCEARNKFFRKVFTTTVVIPDLAKPKINKKSDGIRVTEGADIKLICGCTGTPKPTIRWYLKLNSGSKFEEMMVVTETLHLKNVTADDAGLYKCKAKNEIGTDRYVIKVILEYPPVIKDDHVTKVVAKKGEVINIPCDVTGDPKPTVKWFKNGTILNSNKDIHITSNGLKFMSVKLSDVGLYSCVADNGIGSSEKKVLLDVHVPVHIKVPDETNIETEVGSRQRLTCQADGYPVPEIEWYYQSFDKKSPTKKILSNETTLVLRRLKVEDQGMYTCKASNVDGTSALTYELKVYDPPKIDVYPNKIFISTKGDIKLLINCNVTGNPKPTVIWKRNDLNIAIGSDWYDVENGTLIIKNIDEQSQGTYECLAQNKVGNDSVKYEVIVNVPAKIETNYPNKTFTPVKGDVELKIECKASGNPEPAIVWKKDGVNIVTGTGPYDVKDGTLIISNIEEKLHGKYECLAENKFGNDIVEYDVIIYVPVNIDEPKYNYLEIVENEDQALPCHAHGNPEPEIKWIYNTLDNLTSTDIGKSTSLPLHNLQMKDQGYYICTASNVVGSSSITYEIIVNVLPKIVNVRNTTLTPKEGDPRLEIPCETTGNPEPTIKWSKDNLDIVAGTGQYEIEDGNLIINDISKKTQGVYKCSAENKLGTDTVKYEVIVYVPANIDISGKSNIEKVVGQDFMLHCPAHGTPEPEIQWIFESFDNKLSPQILSNKPSNPLHIQRIQLKDQGRYTCVANNDLGSDKKTYELTVNAPPVIENVYTKNEFTPLKGDSELSIQCKATGRPEPTIIWKKDNSVINIGGSDKYDVEDGTLIINDIDEEAEGTYECVAQNKIGTDTMKYNVIVTVPAYIEKSGDSSFEKMVGQGLSIPCLAHGRPKPDIKWIHKDFALKLPPKTMLPNTGSNSLYFGRVQLKDQGYYTCVASNVAGSDDVTYQVKVNAPPIIANVYPSKKFSPVKGDLALRIMCRATGSPTPTIVWKKDDSVIDFRGSDRYEFEDGTLIIKDIDEKSQGTYVCSAQNTMGTDYMAYEVDVKAYPPITKYSTQMIPRGESAVVKCNIPHTTADSLRWYKGGQLIARGELKLRNTQFGDSGIYSCRVSNMFKSRSAHVQVAVGDKPRFRTNEEEIFHFVEGDDIRLICSIEPIRGVPKPKPPKVTWEHNGEKINRRSLVHRLHMTIDKKGLYTCEVSNDFGTIRRTFNIVSKDCILDTRKDILTKNQPLMFDVTLTWPSFKVNNGLMTIKKDQQFYLYCPGGFHNISSNNVESITCVGETNFEMHGTKLEYNKIKCNGEVMPTVKNTHSRCSYGDTEYLNVGYNVLDQFMEVYDVCVDKENNVPIHTRYELSSAQYGASVNNTKWYEHKLVPLDFDSMYDCDNQARDISFHAHDGCCFDKRQLVSPKDLRPGVPTTATYLYLNVVPHWSTCNTKNWAEVEEKVRNLSKSLGKDLTITTGTAESPDRSSDSYLKDILLHDKRGQKQPAAQYLWKIVQDASSSLVIIQINVPDLSPAEAHSYVHCKDICNRLGWMKSSNWHNTADGYTYCCAVEDFERAFHYPGQFSGSKTAVLIGPYTPIVDTV